MIIQGNTASEKSAHPRIMALGVQSDRLADNAFS